MLPHTGVIAMFGALLPGVVADLTCAVQGMAYSQDNMSKTPNGAFLVTPDMCQSSCSLTVYCQYFTWYNDARFGFHAFAGKGGYFVTELLYCARKIRKLIEVMTEPVDVYSIAYLQQSMIESI